MCYPEEYSQEIEQITFDRTQNPGVLGIAADGIIVFVDKFMNIEVGLGETWLCRLCRGKNDKSKYYFAWPIEKIEKLHEKKKNSDTTEDPEGFVAIGNDTLYSKCLTNGNYAAYRSMNGSWLQLIPEENGNLRCRDNAIAIEGLDEFISGQFPLTLECTSKNDSFLIKLEE